MQTYDYMNCEWVSDEELQRRSEERKEREVSNLEPIKEIGEIKLCFPAILIEQKECAGEVHIPKVFDILIAKIDETVRRVNELSKRLNK